MRRTVVILMLMLLALAVTRAPCGPGELEADAVVASRGEDCQEVGPAAPTSAWQPLEALATTLFVPAGSPRPNLFTGIRLTTTAVPLLARPLRL